MHRKAEEPTKRRKVEGEDGAAAPKAPVGVPADGTGAKPTGAFCAARCRHRRLNAALPAVFRPPVPKGGAAKPKGPGAVQHSASSAEMADVALRFIQNFQMQVMQRRPRTTS
jgi:hypothetical protein